jgi:fermentation-respiration switch protein FrsA (DUF1100 family)
MIDTLTTLFWNMATMVGNIVNYLRLPVIASSGLAVFASGILYFKQKYVIWKSPVWNRRAAGDGWLPYLICLLTAAHYSELIYPRNAPLGARTEVPKPCDFNIKDYEELQLPTPDGESLNAFFIRPSNKRLARNITVLMFHGNAGNIGHRIPIARMLDEALGCNVLMMEYRGYGLSTGTPDEVGLSIDAQTGLDYIRQRTELRNTKIVVYGQSLGGAVAINLVAKNQKEGDIAGLILENTFMSIKKLIPRFVPFLLIDPVVIFFLAKLTRHHSVFPAAKFITRMCHQYWPSDEILPKITDVPVLFLSGLKDEIIPYVPFPSNYPAKET